MALTDDATLPRDPSGESAVGVQGDSTSYVLGVRGDEDAYSMHVSLWRWDSSGLEWVKWDGRMDTVVSGDLIVAVDGVEAKLEDVKTKLDSAITALGDQRLDYLYSGVLEDGSDTYVGYEDKAGNYYVVKYDSNGDPTYTTGSGGIPDKSTPSNWTGESYASVMATF